MAKVKVEIPKEVPRKYRELYREKYLFNISKKMKLSPQKAKEWALRTIQACLETDAVTAANRSSRVTVE